MADRRTCRPVALRGGAMRCDALRGVAAREERSHRNAPRRKCFLQKAQSFPRLTDSRISAGKLAGSSGASGIIPFADAQMAVCD